jgi:hypothetical protein
LGKPREAGLRADVSSAFLDSTLPEMLRDCTDAMVRHIDAGCARIWTVNEAGDFLELQASSGIYTNIDGTYSRQAIGKPIVGAIAQESRLSMVREGDITRIVDLSYYYMRA